MARITVEDCLVKENNRFALVQLAAKRTKQLLNGSKVLLEDQRGNKAVVTALREIAAGQVRFLSAEEKRLKEEERMRAAEAARVARETPLPTMADSGSDSSDSSSGTPSGSSSNDSEGDSETDVASTNGAH